MGNLAARPRPAPADIALALLLFAAKVTFVLTGTLTDGTASVLAVLVAALLTLPLAYRRIAPATVAWIVAVTLAVDDLIAGWDGAVLSFDCSIVAAYSAGAHARQPAAAAALTGLVAANVVDALGAPGNTSGNLAIGIVVFSLVPWLVGQALRRERGRTSQLRQLTDDLAREREERAQEAVLAERGRIARELHDVVAHAVSLIAVQADAAGKLLRRDPARAEEPLGVIETTARSAMTEMRRMVGLLRADDSGPPLSPLRGSAGIEELVAEARRTGLSVEFDTNGLEHDLPATLDLAVFRIAQEGLTNVLKHASASRATLRIISGGKTVTVEVLDDGAGFSSSNDGGRGLIGIRERVTLLGGTLECGPRREGGFALRAKLPLTPVVS